MENYIHTYVSIPLGGCAEGSGGLGRTHRDREMEQKSSLSLRSHCFLLVNLCREIHTPALDAEQQGGVGLGWACSGLPASPSHLDVCRPALLLFSAGGLSKVENEDATDCQASLSLGVVRGVKARQKKQVSRGLGWRPCLGNTASGLWFTAWQRLSSSSTEHSLGNPHIFLIADMNFSNMEKLRHLEEPTSEKLRGFSQTLK